MARGGMSQAAFAKALEISKGSLGFYERNENLPNSDVVIKICSLTGVSLQWLLMGSGAMCLEEEEPKVEYTAAETIAKLEEKVSSLEQQLLEARAEAIRAYKLAISHMQTESEIIQKADFQRATHTPAKQAYSEQRVEEKT